MLSQKDKATLQRLLHGDEKEFHAFYEEHFLSLHQYLMRKLSQQDAEEVAQDAFMSFIESLRNFQGMCSLKTFLYSIAKRKAIDKLRKKKLKKIVFSYFPEGIVDSLTKVFFKDNLDQAYLAHKIEIVLENLPHDYAHLIRLKYVEGHKVDVIAEKVDLPFKAAESKLYRARKAFIKLYNQYESEHVFTFEESL